MRRPSSRSALSAVSDEEDARELAAFMAGEDPVDVAAAQWLLQCQEGLSAADRMQYEAWLAADPKHGAALQRLQDLWLGLAAIPASSVTPAPVPTPQTQTETQAQTRTGTASESVRPPRAASTARPGGVGPRAAGWGWVATAGRLVPQFTAAAVAFAMVGAGWWSWDSWRSRPVFSQSFSTLRGQQKQVRLPDGSTLLLDTATRIQATFYRDRREISLPEGQVMFTVQSNAQQPFHVLSGPVRVTVVGTRFSVRNAPGGLQQGAVSVEVEEGRVRVARAADAAPTSVSAPALGAVLLTAGQAVVADDQGALGRVVSTAPGHVAAWRQARVDFDATPLRDALNEFGRYGPTDFRIRDPRVAALRVTGSFDLRRVDAFARALPQVLPVRLEPAAGTTDIVAAGQP